MLLPTISAIIKVFPIGLAANDEDMLEQLSQGIKQAHGALLHGRVLAVDGMGFGVIATFPFATDVEMQKDYQYHARMLMLDTFLPQHVIPEAQIILLLEQFRILSPPRDL